MVRLLAQALEGRFLPLAISIVATAIISLTLLLFSQVAYYLWVPLLLSAGLSLVGLHDLTQTRHAILRNYPFLGHLRFFFEKIRPEMRQYFFEADTDGRPFPRKNGPSSISTPSGSSTRNHSAR